MSEIRNLKPEGLWRNFDDLTQVPRPSGLPEKVQKFLLDFAARVGVESYVDAGGNVVMRKPATPGYENRKTVLLQAHMDMVPQKAPDSIITLKQTLSKLTLPMVGCMQTIRHSVLITVLALLRLWVLWKTRV